MAAALLAASGSWPTPASAAATAPARPSSASLAADHLLSAKLHAVSPITPGGTWSWQNPQPNGNALGAISCPTALVCFAAGDNGPILATTDGGAHWTRQQTETGVLGLSCGDATHCFGLTLNAGTISTSDGGTTWTSAPSSFGQLYGVFCNTNLVCLGVGDNGMIAELTPTPGQQTSGTTVPLFGVTCAAICVAVGYNGTFLRQQGGGWAAVQTATTAFLITVSCSTICVAGGSGGTAVTWDMSSTGAAPFNVGSKADIYGSTCPGSTCMLAATDGNLYVGALTSWGPEDVGAPGSVWSVACPSATSCFVSGDGNFIASTSTGGTGWKFTPGTGAAGGLQAISCPAASTCFTAGTRTQKRTTDGGATWTDTALANDMRAISCPSTTVCYAAGAQHINVGSVIYKTTDAGSTWTSPALPAPPTSLAQGLFTINCPTTTTCFAGGDEGELYVTTDGTTWSAQDPGTFNAVVAISCADATHCLALTAQGQFGSMIRTTDGKTWSTVLSLNGPILAGVKCVPASTVCYAVGKDANTNYTVYRTTDDGATWSHQSFAGSYPNPLTSIDCLSTTHCFAVGQSGDIYGTTDGTTWTLEAGPYGTWESVSCATSTTVVCYVVDFFNSIARTTNDGATWLKVWPSNFTDDFTAISCPSTTTCFAGTRSQQNGGHGTVVVTTDGGTTWKQLLTQRGGTADPLFDSIACPTASVCFTADSVTSAGKQLISWTADGGATWSSTQVGTSSAITSISCPSATTCFAGDAAGNFVKTADGGTTWSAPAPVTSTGVSGLSCPTTLVCFATGVAKPGHVYATSDGGAHWALSFDLSADPQGGSTAAFVAISCSSSSVCSAVGAGGLAATTTDATLWRTDNVGSAADLTAVSCPTDSTCFGTTNHTSVLRSTDWGGTWLPQFPGEYPGNILTPFFALSCPSTMTCMAVGQFGATSTTGVGGSAWTRVQPVGLINFLGSVSCPDASDCYAGDFGGGAPSGVTVTHDGGATWTHHSVSKADITEAVSCASINICFAAGWPGAIYSTTDGGTTWAYESNPLAGADETFSSVSCPSTSTCYVSGTQGHILRTTDGGSTWTLMASGTTQFILGIACATTASCVAVGSGGVTLSLTGGAWQVHPSGIITALDAVSCPTAARCFAAGNSGQILRTDNGGMTWNPQSSGVTAVLRAVQCTSSTSCLAAGDSGTVVYTLDGATWSSTTVPTTNQIRGVAFLNPGVAWLVGADGTILKNPNLFFLCLTTVISSDRTSPVAIGETVTFTASNPGGCTGLFEFWLLPPGGTWTLVQSYSGSVSWAWSTAGQRAGNYSISVWAHDAGSPGAAGSPPNTFDSYTGMSLTLQATPCSNVVVSPGQLPPATTGDTIAFTAVASGCPHPLYEFWIEPPGGAWSIAKAYSLAPTFTWYTAGLAAGTYHYSVWARALGSTNAYDTYAPGAPYVLYSVPPCVSASASVSPKSPQPAGTAVTITASSTGCSHPNYEFWIQSPGGSWTIAQAYSSNATFAWNTAPPAGTYHYSVWIRDASSAASYDSYFPGTAYALTTTPCTSVTASASPASPQASGTTITISVSASGCTNPRYEFWIQAPGGSWTIAAPYSSSTTFTWNTTGLTPGTYKYSVWVRDASSAASYDTYFPGTVFMLN